MPRTTTVAAATVLTAVTLFATGGSAGPERIALPAGWDKFVLYNTVDRYEYDFGLHPAMKGTVEVK